MSESVGIIGLGVMGGAIAARLLDSQRRVVGFDIDLLRADALTLLGGEAARDVAELAKAADVILLSLPSTEAFAQVIGQLCRLSTAGLLVIDASTLSFEVKQSGRDALAAVGGVLLDCPLSGTGQQARHGDLVAYLSGDAAAVERAAPVIACFTRSIHRLGEFGQGTRMKLIANLLVAIHNVAAAEALLLAQRSGLDPALVLAAVGDGAGTSRMFEVRGPLMTDENFDEPTMRVEVFVKDLDLIASFAATSGTPTPLFSAATVIYQAAVAQGRGGQDTASVYGVLKRLSSPMDETSTE